MMESHVQSRILTDALSAANLILEDRGTKLKDCREWQDLANCFSTEPDARFFHSWAFTAREYEEMSEQVRSVAPHLASQLRSPTNAKDFTIVGHSSLDMRFIADPNGVETVAIRMADGSSVLGAKVTSGGAKQFSNGLVALPAAALSGRKAPQFYALGMSRKAPLDWVYFFQPQSASRHAAQMAAEVFAGRGSVEHEDLILYFPRARTNQLPDYPWVIELTDLTSEYIVSNHVMDGEAIIDENGFFVRETQIVQMLYTCLTKKKQEVVIDGPFLVFFADDGGIHAAAWFDRDAFGSTVLPD